MSWGSQPSKGTCSGHAADLNQGGNRRSILGKIILTLKFREVCISSDSSDSSLEGHKVRWYTKWKRTRILATTQIKTKVDYFLLRACVWQLVVARWRWLPKSSPERISAAVQHQTPAWTSGPQNSIRVGVPLGLNLPDNPSIQHAPKPVCPCMLPNKSSWQKAPNKWSYWSIGICSRHRAHHFWHKKMVFGTS